MSCNYADGLSPYHDKGQLGLEEKFDSKSVVSAKVSLLSKWINEAKHVVIHTGAGISTSAGIPDFRGPRGVWTLQAKGEKPDLSKDFNEAVPTITHMAIMKLVEKEKVKFVVSQNIDGLHLRSNLPRKFLSELHGNMFTEQCSSCHRQFVRSVPVPTVGQKSLNKPCPASKTNGRPCRGKLHDTILDWEHSLPENDLGMADYHSCLADLSICLGTTMQIVPSGNLPLYTKKHGGKLVIVNLQPTKHNRKADLLINAYVDEVMTMLMKNLNIKIPKYSPKNDPTRTLSQLSEKFLEWTISDYALQKMKKIYEEKCGTKEAKKRLEMIEDDIPLSIKTFKRKGKDEEDSDLEVLDVIVKPKKTRETSKKGGKKNSAPVYNTTITIKKIPPPPKKSKFEGTEKITIKKNVTPTKTKYEIVTKPKKVPKCEIVYNFDSELCNDLEMICESDDDDSTNNFTYNFKRYLSDNIKKEDGKESDTTDAETKEVKTEIKSEIKDEEEESGKDSNEETNEKSVTAKKEGIDDESMETDNTNTEKTEENEKENEDLSKIDVRPSDDLTNNLKPVDENSENFENSSVDEVEQNITEATQSNTSEKSEKTSEKDKSDEESKEESKSNTNENFAQETSQVQEETQLNADALSPQTNVEKGASAETGESLEVKKKNESSTISEEQRNENGDSVYQNMEPEISSLTNSNLESQINQMVSQTQSSQYDSSLDISNCNMNSSINENYEFYNNEFINTTNNATDLDYVYNNF